MEKDEAGSCGKKTVKERRATLESSHLSMNPNFRDGNRQVGQTYLE